MEAGPVGSRGMGEDIDRASSGNVSGKLSCKGEWKNGALFRVREV